jgi:hypothetical protein
LIEEQRSNLLTNSSQFSSWNALDQTVTSNTSLTTAPDGTTTADILVAAANTNEHITYQSYNFPSGSHIFSVYLKAAGFTLPQLRLDIGGVIRASVFNLSTGTVSSTGSGQTASIVSVGDGWYRCSVAATVSGVQFYGIRSTGGLGDGTSGVFAWGAQLEAGSFATSYIPTAASTVTRSADVASVGVSQFSYSATSGTVVIEATACDATAASSGGVSPQSVALYADTNNELYLYRAASSNLTGLYGATSGSPVVNSTTTAWPNGATRKAGFAYAVDDFSLVFAGGTPVTDTAGTPATATQLNIGRRGNNAGFWNGYIRQITYLPRRLTNTELQAKTSA